VHYEKIFLHYKGLQRKIILLPFLLPLHAFDDCVRKALKGVAGVRNFFAHNLGASFDSTDKEYDKAFGRLVHQDLTYYPHPFLTGDSDQVIEKITDRPKRASADALRSVPELISAPSSVLV
jgi:hypothetical protein